ncbi:MAG: hypothetical protein AAF480_07660 [Actinomycetota bacterium]
MPRRWLLVLASALVLTGCSGSRPFGVTTTTAGSLEVLSSCDDVGISDVHVFAVGADQTLLAHLRPLGPRDDLPARVVVGASSPTHEVVVANGLPLAGTVRVSADYPLAATFTEDVIVDLSELGPGEVATSSFDGSTTRTTVETLDSFVSSRRSCLGLDVPVGVWLPFLAVLTAGAVTALVAMWRFVRSPAAPTPSSTLPHPPSRPPT